VILCAIRIDRFFFSELNQQILSIFNEIRVLINITLSFLKLRSAQSSNMPSSSKILTIRGGFLLLFYISIALHTSLAQNTEPRRWTPLPLGVNAVAAGYGYSFGDLYLDPLLQAEDVSIDAHTFFISYLHPFRLGNKLARLDVVMPFNIADYEGLLQGVPTTVNRTGFADPRIRLTANIIGPPAVGPKELREFYIEHPVYTTFSASVAVSLPLGEYFEDKLINLGQNIFVITPQLGVLHRWAKWSAEGTLSLNIFTNNNNFASGKTKRQRPTFSIQSHFTRDFEKGFSASAGIGYGLGGQSIVNRIPNADNRADIQAVASVGFPVAKNQVVNVVYIRSQTLRDVGSDTNSFVLAYSVLF
jgi:hypothetical protein